LFSPFYIIFKFGFKSLNTTNNYHRRYLAAGTESFGLMQIKFFDHFFHKILRFYPFFVIYIFYLMEEMWFLVEDRVFRHTYTKVCTYIFARLAFICGGRERDSPDALPACVSLLLTLCFLANTFVPFSTLSPRYHNKRQLLLIRLIAP